ncbi:response regulator transcription factor [Actinomadura rubteroloni]|uniref:response regulator transcription factor n=1 Tax=Actinomadura rubteroloni TaxID=1926885 RepID=UPI0011B07514|nr:response regulator transcription factor [Actinomadura rubteroloni]
MAFRRTGGTPPAPPAPTVPRVRIAARDPAVAGRLAAALTGAGLAETSGEPPDVVLLDLGPPREGLAVLAGLLAGDGPPAVLVLTGERPDRHVLRALRAGARGFVPGALTGAALADAVRAAAAGRTVLGPGEPPGPAALGRVRALPEADAAVLACLGEGLSDRQIARCLRLRRGSADRHVARVVGRLGCADRVEAGLLAFAAGL